ncbi:hypothetical protein ABIB51_003325 [Arthrobacter sp. UYCu712]
MPQLTMMRASQILAPYFSIIMLLGSSKIAYAMKKSPAPKPYAAAPMPTSASTCSWA